LTAYWGTAVDDAPLLSVIVPAHNAGAFLQQCIDALEASDLPRNRWELIVVDDASDDQTSEIARRADRAIRLDGSARGPAFARNRGAEAASAGLIAFVDADVCVRADALRRIVERLRNEPDLSAVFGAYDDTPAAPSATSQYRNLLHHYVHLRSAGETGSFWAGLGAIRTADFFEAGKFNEGRYVSPQIEDVELGYRLRATKKRILIDPSICGTHLKEWTLGGIVRTDLNQRGIPWVKLLLERGSAAAAQGPSLGMAEVASVGFVGVAVLAVILWPITGRAEFLSGAALALAISVALSARFHLWLLSARGPWIALVSIPLYLLYKLTSVVAVVAGTGAFLLQGSEPRSIQTAASTDGKPSRTFLGFAAGEAGSRVIAFVATAYIARRLGASAFGYLGFATAIVGYFGTALSAGISEIGAREVARYPEEAQSIAAGGTLVRLAGAIIALLIVIVISAFVPLPVIGRLVIALTGLSLISIAVDTSWVYKGLGKSRRAGSAQLIAQLASASLLILLIHDSSNVVRVPVIQFVADLLAAGFLAIPLLGSAWVSAKFSDGLRLVRQSGLITVTRIFRAMIISIDVVLLGLLTTSAQVGLYSAAYRIVFFVMAVAYASHISWLPAVTRTVAAGQSPDAAFSGTLRLSLIVTLPFVVGGALIAPQLMGTIFGSEYAPAGTALRLLLISLLFIALHGATRNLFLAYERLGWETAIMGVGVALNVGLNLFLIPRYGLTGAAFATAAAEALVLAACVIAVDRLGVRASLKPLVTPLLAGAAMAAALVLIGVDKPAVLSIAIGALVYGGALAVLTRVTR
jgi:O-antigen/teichoic acid export membrane protein